MWNLSQENEIRSFSVDNELPRHSSFMESMEIFSNEINMRLYQEMVYSDVYDAHSDYQGHKLCNQWKSHPWKARYCGFIVCGICQNSSEDTDGLKTKLKERL